MQFIRCEDVNSRLEYGANGNSFADYRACDTPVWLPGLRTISELDKKLSYS